MHEAVWPDLAGSRAVLAGPVGATEQHGPHLTRTTDSDIAVAVVERLAVERGDEGVRAVSDEAVLGDPADASAGGGELLLSGAVEARCRRLDHRGGG
jgi:creatinine amidohydrolase/Fe(II)-dependent formamide hydrolase-like protein